MLQTGRSYNITIVKSWYTRAVATALASSTDTYRWMWRREQMWWWVALQTLLTCQSCTELKHSCTNYSVLSIITPKLFTVVVTGTVAWATLTEQIFFLLTWVLRPCLSRLLQSCLNWHIAHWHPASSIQTESRHWWLRWLHQCWVLYIIVSSAYWAWLTCSDWVMTLTIGEV